jgi:hypothetical protein
MNWIKKHGINIILIIVSVVVTIIVTDIILYYFTHYRYAITKLDYPRFYFIKDSELGTDISPNFATSTHYFEDAAFPVWSNNIGCFDINYASETPYIYMAGDSLTWGFSPFNDTWGKKIETSMGIRTVKCGVTGGYGTKQELRRTSRHLSKLPLPNLIIVGYTQVNDFDEDANFPINTVHNGYLVPNLAKNNVTETEAEEKYNLFNKYCSLEASACPIISRVRCFFSNNSVLYNLFRKKIRDVLVFLFPHSILENIGFIAPNKPILEAKSDVEWLKHLDNILAFKKLAENKKSKLLFVLYPSGDSVEFEKLKSFLDKNEIIYLDTSKIFDKYSKIKPLIWKLNGHWNIAGNHIVGMEVSKFIIENDLIKIVDKTERIEAINAQIKSEFGVTF